MVDFFAIRALFTHLFHLLTEGGTITLVRSTQLVSAARLPYSEKVVLTVPYFPVTPTLRVRLVCGGRAFVQYTGIVSFDILLTILKNVLRGLSTALDSYGFV